MMAQLAASARYVLKLLLLLAVGLPGFVLAAPEDYEGLPIREIRFDPALQPLPDIELRQMLPFEAGDKLDLDAVTAAIIRLYETGRYENIAADATLEDGEVELRFLTRSRWFVGRVSVEGAPAPPQAGQLINATRLELGGAFTEEDSEAALDNILDVLRRNGLFEARAERFLDYEPSFAQVNLLFDVTPGPRAHFGPPVVEGVPEEEADDVIGATNWKRFWVLPGWKPVTARRTQNGLERIREFYQNRDRLLSAVTLEGMDYDAEDNRVVPRIRIEPGPRVRVTVSGAEIGSGRLRRLVPIYQEQTVDQDLLVEGARNLTEYFQSEGYFDATVTFDRSTRGDTDVIEYQVDRGPRKRLVGLEITGNTYFDDATIRERLSSTPATTLRYRRGRFNQALLDSDVAAIEYLYRSNGFREVEVDTSTEPVSPSNPREVVLTFQIDEGDQWFVTGLEMTGVSDVIAPYLGELLGSTPGQVFSEANLVIDRDNVLDFYYNNGYPDATVRFSARESERPGRVELELVVEEGLRQYVRASLIGGLEITDRELVQSRIRLEPGQPLSQAEIVESQRRLYDLGIFARVDTAVQNPEGTEDRKYVLHQFEEARRWSVNAGIGAQIARIGGGAPDFDNPGGSPGFSPRLSFGLGRLNMFGVAHTASMQSQVSDTRRRVLTNYTAPQFQGAENVSLSFTGLYDFSRDINTFDSTRLEGSVSISQRISRASTLQYRFTYRRVKTENLALDPELVPIFARSVRVGLIGVGIIRDRRDDPLLTTRGTYNAVEMEVASKYLGSETDYLRLVGRNSTYHRLGGDFVLARSLTVGWLANTASANTDRPIPLPERIYSGGASSHRGFPDNQAGPRDPTTGFVIGGRAVAIHNLELRFPLIGDNLGGVLFHDVGNVYSEMANFSFRFRQRDKTDFDYMVHSAGVGIRYGTPIGPIRFDVSFSPNSPRFFGFEGTREDLIAGGGEPVDQRINRLQFFFSIGQTF